MRVYQLALALAGHVDQIRDGLPDRVKNISKQLERAMDSVTLNLMEGLTAFQKGTKASAFHITRKETGEVKMALRRLVMRKARTREAIQKPIEEADCLIGMLTVMIKQQEERED